MEKPGGGEEQATKEDGAEETAKEDSAHIATTRTCVPFDAARIHQTEETTDNESRGSHQERNIFAPVPALPNWYVGKAHYIAVANLFVVAKVVSIVLQRGKDAIRSFLMLTCCTLRTQFLAGQYISGSIVLGYPRRAIESRRTARASWYFLCSVQAHKREQLLRRSLCNVSSWTITLELSNTQRLDELFGVLVGV